MILPIVLHAFIYLLWRFLVRDAPVPLWVVNWAHLDGDYLLYGEHDNGYMIGSGAAAGELMAINIHIH